MDDLIRTHGLPYSGPDGFDTVYQSGAPPWDIGRPQPSLEALADAGLIEGRVLDAGCGTGEHALMVARLGLEATGIDFATTALQAAREKARARGLRVRFVEGDALDLPALGETFDTVIDCGLFHVLDDDQRSAYVRSLAAVINTGGRYFLLCFNEHVPGDAGPRRIRQNEIRAAFSDGWRVDGIEASSITSRLGPPVPAWLAALTRL